MTSCCLNILQELVSEKYTGTSFFGIFPPRDNFVFIYKIFALVLTETEIYNLALEINPLTQQSFWQNLAKNLTTIILY